jgi:curved DNA-binding protein CbpA
VTHHRERIFSCLPLATRKEDDDEERGKRKSRKKKPHDTNTKTAFRDSCCLGQTSLPPSFPILNWTESNQNKMKWTSITLTLAVAQLSSANAFVILRPPGATVTVTANTYRHNKSLRICTVPTTSRLFMNANNNNSNDPFLLLGLNEPTSDKAVIKRAYKRMALKFHPDMATTKDSTAQEKKDASDVFAKINWAYQTLSGKRNKDDTTYGKQSAGSASSTSSTGGWTPPHRRSGAYSSSSGQSTSSTGSGASTDWRDYMPQKDEEDAKYDAGGDSLGQIFSDLFAGAAGAAAGYSGSSSSSSSIFKDFVDFLEGNIDGYGGGSRDDTDLRVLLQTASIQEIKNEMDDTELVVQQLNTKFGKLKDEIIMVEAQVKLQQQRYMERMELEESMAELEARKQVVDGYLKKAQTRLLALQVRYKDLLTRGNNSGGGGDRNSEWDDIKREATTSSTYTSGSSSSRGSSTSGGSSSPNTSGGSSSTSSSSSSRASGSSTSTANKDDEDAWMNEGFGSSRGSRGSGRRRRSSQTSSTSSGPSSTATGSSSSSSRSRTQPQQEPVRPPPSRQSQESVRPPPTRTSSSSSSSTSRSSEDDSSSYVSSYVPPHRRTSDFSSMQEDKRRMREMKVDEEFDKLKKELGL